jgi:tetratricopeptide (TPR) repeat protein
MDLRSRLALALVCVLAASAHADPDSVAAARELYQQGRYEEAIVEYESAMGTEALTIRDRALLALAYAQTDRLDAARRVARHAVTVAPSDPFVVLANANVLFQSKRYRMAEAAFARAYELDRSLIAARNGRIAALVNLAAASMEAGALGEADRLIERALQIDDRSVPALRAFVVLRRAQESDDGVVPALERLAELRPREAEVHVELARRYLATGREHDAVSAYLNAEAHGTNDPFTYLFLARRLRTDAGPARTADRLHQAIGKAIRKGGAIQMRLASRLEADQSDLTERELDDISAQARAMDETASLITESLALLRDVRSSPEAFRGDLELLRSWYPTSTHLETAYGRLLEEQGRWDAAYEQWRSLLDDHPMLARAHVGLARTLEQLGRDDRARLAYLRALDQEPENAAIYRALERLHTNELSRLRQALLDRYAIDPWNTTLLRSLVRVERELGLTDAADQHELRISEIVTKQEEKQ